MSADDHRVTLSGKPPETAHDDCRAHPEIAAACPECRALTRAAPGPIDPATGMHTDYWVLSAEERAKGFVRPVRTSYVHTKCRGATKMGLTIAETYARDPSFYGATMCVHCHAHFPVGAAGEFTWDDGSKVGT